MHENVADIKNRLDLMRTDDRLLCMVKIIFKSQQDEDLCKTLYNGSLRVNTDANGFITNDKKAIEKILEFLPEAQVCEDGSICLFAPDYDFLLNRLSYIDYNITFKGTVFFEDSDVNMVRFDVTVEITNDKVNPEDYFG